MKWLTIVGILLLVGVLLLLFQAISPEREKAIRVGPVRVSAEQAERVSLQRLVGGLALDRGALLVVNETKASSRTSVLTEPTGRSALTGEPPIGRPERSEQ